MFSKEIYRNRRARLAQQVSSGLVFLPGHPTSPINFADNVYPFRQDSTFLYFGGPSVPGLAMLVDCDANRSLLFGREADADEVLWCGSSPALEHWAQRAAFDECLPLTDLEAQLQTARRQGRSIHFLPPYRADQVLLLSRLLEISADQVTPQASP
ncbi:MAG: aminopeptidase P N-terminal domain-containing protein, partial [Desulfobacterales bacterium]